MHTARKLPENILPKDLTYYDDIIIYKDFWVDSNLSITDALLMSLLESIIYDNKGSIYTTSHSLLNMLSGFSGLSHKSSDRFFNKMIKLGYLTIIHKSNNNILFTCKRITDDMDEYIAECNIDSVEPWMLSYMKNKITKAYFTDKFTKEGLL